MSETDAVKDRFRKLMDRLDEKTRANQLAWVPGTDDDSFQVHFANFSVEINLDETYGRYFARLYDQQGRVIESINVANLDRERENKYSRMISDLYTSARRKALNINKAFDDILAALD